MVDLILDIFIFKQILDLLIHSIQIWLAFRCLLLISFNLHPIMRRIVAWPLPLSLCFEMAQILTAFLKENLANFVLFVKDLSKSDTPLQPVTFLFMKWIIPWIFQIYLRRKELHFW